MQPPLNSYYRYSKGTKSEKIRHWAYLIALGIACKPQVVGTRLLEEGGTSTDWRLKATLSTEGQLRIERVGAPISNVPADAGDIQRVEVELAKTLEASATVVSAGNFQEPNPVLDLRLNLLLHMKDGRFCYANNVQLNGPEESVSCKADMQQPIATDGPAICQDLTRQSCLDNGAYGVINPDTSGCRCGDALLRFDDYVGRAEDFRAACRDTARSSVVPPTGEIPQRPAELCP